MPGPLGPRPPGTRGIRRPGPGSSAPASGADPAARLEIRRGRAELRAEVDGVEATLSVGVGRLAMDGDNTHNA